MENLNFGQQVPKIPDSFGELTPAQIMELVNGYKEKYDQVYGPNNDFKITEIKEGETPSEVLKSFTTKDVINTAQIADKLKEFNPIGFLVHEASKTAIPLYKKIGCFEKFMWKTLFHMKYKTAEQWKNESMKTNPFNI